MGVVRNHGDEEASMVEIEFHNTSTHHAFSMPNPLGFSMAALNEQALVLACERSDDVPRYNGQLCETHYEVLPPSGA